MAKRRNPLSPLARPGRPTTTDLMPGEGGFVETDSPSLQRSVPSPITNKERQKLVEAVARGKTRKIRAEAAERLKTVLALEAEGLEPHFAQSGQNVLDSERQLLQEAYDRAAARQPGLASPVDAGRLDPSGNVTVAERAALNDIESRSLSRQAAKNVGASMPIGAGDLAAGGNVLASERAGLKAVEARTAARVAAKGAGAAGVAADVAGGTISAGALAAMTNKGGTISKGALASMANKGSTISKGALGALAKATGKSVGFLTKAAGVLGWAGLAYTLYENTIGRRNEARQQEAGILAEVGMNGLAQAPQYGEEAYGRLLPGLASGSEAVASASDRTEFNNAVSLDSLLRQNQGALQQAAQVTPVSFEEFMLRVKAEMAARGG